MNTDRERLDVGRDAQAVAERALAEDGRVDITSEVVGASGTAAVGRIEYRSGGVVAGKAYADAVAELCACGRLNWAAEDGDEVAAEAVIASVEGDLARILVAERTMLNLLQRACGIATATRRFAEALAGTGCTVLHTRKTTPGLRIFEIDSVLAGGGGLHRLSLESAVLVKDNHWHVLGRNEIALETACESAKKRGVEGIFVEVEGVEQVQTACKAGATRLLIDNQNPADFKHLAEAARKLAPAVEIEATGGMSLDTARVYAEHGADFISVGALTHSVKAADIALEITAID